jgi:hypothetical protein
VTSGQMVVCRREVAMLRVTREYLKFALSALTSVMYHQT